ncbi:MAG: sensor histidine kinase, partial [Bdellovibrionales bacterium]
RMVNIGDLRETILTLSQAKLDYFDAVVYYDNQGTKVFSLPVDLHPKIIDQHRIKNVLRYGYVNTSISYGANSNALLGTLTFAYGRYEYVKYAIGLWLILLLTTLPLIAGARRSVVERYMRDLKIKSDLARAELAKQVRHDIRSPLISLQGLLSASQSLNTAERRVLDRIITRIFGIIADLEDAPHSPPRNDRSKSGTAIEEVVKDVLREKQLQTKKPIQFMSKFEPSSFLAYTAMGRLQLSRILSNILDNSIEAIEGAGKVQISLRVALGSVILEIEDNGMGIPPDILPKIFEKNFSFDKPSGSGIGLSSAKDVVEGCGGKISATSTPGKGTKITLDLPVKNQPAWWMDKIDTSDISQIVVVDDQETSHDAWRMKLRGTVACEHITSGEELKGWLTRNGTAKTLFLVDFDLGKNSPNGIDLVESFGLAKQSILVTGNFDDLHLQSQCASLKLKLLPKPLIDAVAVV